MTPMEAYDLLFLAMLGRKPSAQEKDEITGRYRGVKIADISAIGHEIALSSEFHYRYRENFVYNLFPQSTVVTARGPLGHELLVDLRQFHLGFSIANGHFEGDETAFVLRTVKRGWTVLDVGANIGYFSTIFAAVVGNAGRVIAFEPVSDTFLKLKAAISLNGFEGIIDARPAAASNCAGQCQIAYGVNSANMGGVSISPLGTATREQVKEIAETVRIDDAVGQRPIHFIKMDVEGAEGLALDGAHDVISRCRPIMMIEFNAVHLAQVSNLTPVQLYDKVVGHGYKSSKIAAHGMLEAFSRSDLEAMTGDFIINLAFHPN